MARTRGAGNRSLGVPSTNRKSCKYGDDSVFVPWSTLDQDLLFIILMQLGVIDFIAFSGVCRTWRSFAHAHRESFMLSKEPMVVSISSRAKRACSLIDIFGERSFKTLLPNFSGRMCIGLTSGFLIMFGKITHDFWLINPLTRHELIFPALPSSFEFILPDFRTILVFSPSFCAYVLVTTVRDSKKILFAVSSDTSGWSIFSSDVAVMDLHAVNGKIYVLDWDGTLGEMRLRPEPTLTPLHIKVRYIMPSSTPELLSSSKKLFMIDFILPEMCVVLELDSEKLEWIIRGEASMNDYALFKSYLKCCAVVERSNWADPRRQCDTEIFTLGNIDLSALFASEIPVINMLDSGRTNLWCFPHDCYTVNRLQE